MTGVVDPKAEADARARHAEVRAAFLRCRGLSGEERGTALEGLDGRLRREVEELLAAETADDALSDRRIEGRAPLAPWIAPAAEAEEPLPERIAGFRVLRRLGAGGMGVVYEAEQEAPRRRVAVKLVRAGLAHGERFRRFRQEAEALGRLQHPGIAQIFDFGLCNLGHGEQPFFAMELIDGRPLLAHAAEARLDRRARLALVTELCDAVQHAHERGVVHRDLKPDNVLVDTAGRAKVLDFGVARVRADDVPLTTIQTAQGQIVGTLTHMAPEQLTGNPDAVGPAADIYALGVIAFELLTGRLPLELAGLPIGTAMRRIAEEDAPRLGKLDARLRGDVETIVGKCLEHDPAQRYVSPAALAADLRRHLAHEPIVARQTGAFGRALKFSRRNRALVGGVVATTVTLVAATIVSTRFAFVAEANRARSERQAYRSALAAVSASLNETSPASPRRSLDAAPERLRGWEWRHLASRLETSGVQLGAPLAGLEGLASAPVSGRLCSAHADGDGIVLRLCAPNGDELARASAPGIRFLDVGFDASEATILAAGARSNGGVRVVAWDPASGELATRLELDWATSARLSAETGQICVSSAEPDRSAVLHIATGAERIRIEPAIFQSVSFGNGGRWIGGATVHGAFAVHDVEAGLRLFSKSGGLGMLARDSTRVVLHSGGDELIVLDLASQPPAQVASFSTPTSTWHRILSPDGGRAAWLGLDGVLRVLDVGLGRTLGPFGQQDATPRGLAFVSGGERVVTASSAGTLHAWTLATPDVPELRGHTSFVYAVAIDPSGEWLASGGWDGFVGEGGALRLWDLASGAEVAAWGEPGTILSSLAWVADPCDLIVGGGSPRGNFVRRYALDGRTRWTCSIGKPVEQISVSADGARVIASTVLGGLFSIDALDGTERAADEATWRFPDAPKEETASYWHSYALACSPTQSLFVVAGERFRIELRDVTTLRLLRSWPAHSRAIAGFGFSPDGKLLASASEDGWTRVWRVADGAEVAPAMQHDQGVLCARFSPDGRRLVTGGRDGVVRVFDTEHHEEQVGLEGHSGYVKELAWSLDGETLVSASGDTTLRLWDVRNAHERLAATSERERLVSEVSGRVSGWLADEPDPAAALPLVREAEFGSADARRVALQLVLSRCWAVHEHDR